MKYMYIKKHTVEKINLDTSKTKSDVIHLSKIISIL